MTVHFKVIKILGRSNFIFENFLGARHRYKAVNASYNTYPQELSFIIVGTATSPIFAEHSVARKEPFREA